MHVYKIIATVGKWQKSNEFVKTDQLEHCNDASSKQSNLGEKFLMKKEKGDDDADDDDFFYLTARVPYTTSQGMLIHQRFRSRFLKYDIIRTGWGGPLGPKNCFIFGVKQIQTKIQIQTQIHL